jgi:hypothetical protein
LTISEQLAGRGIDFGALSLPVFAEHVGVG